MILSLALFAAPVHAAPTDEAVSEMMSKVQIEQKLELVDAGKGKKRLVGFAPRPGATSTTRMSNSQEMEMTIIGPDGKAVPLPNMGQMQPTMTFTINTVVGEPRDNGMIPVDYTYGPAEVSNVPPEMASSMQEGMKVLEGLGFTALFEGGRVVQTDVSTEDQAMFEGLQSMVDQFASQMPSFPEEKIGVGAVYTLEARMNLAGLDMLMLATSTVRALEKDSITTDNVYTMKLESSTLDFPGLPPGAEMTFTEFAGSGTGMLTTNLEDLSIDGSLTMEMDIGMAMKGPEVPEGVTMTMSMKQSTVYE